MIKTTKLSQEQSIEKASNAYQAYMAALDGNKKELPGHLFDELTDVNITGMVNGRHITRKELIAMHSEYFESGTKATIMHLKRVGKNQLDAKVRLHNDNGDRFLRKLLTVRNGKIVAFIKYTSTLASMYPSDSDKKQTRPRHYYAGSTIVECAVATDTKTHHKRDQVNHFFTEAFEKIGIKSHPESSAE